MSVIHTLYRLTDGHAGWHTWYTAVEYAAVINTT